MSEIDDFKFFEQNQLINFDPLTGQLDVITGTNKICIDVGSVNPDGYVRLHCNGNLRMKHRLVYWLMFHNLPSKGFEIDHIDKDRSNNAPFNLRILSKSKNNTNCVDRNITHMDEATVVQVCELLANTTMSDLDIANIVGRSRATIRDIKTRRTRTKISYKYSWPHRL